jgi:hypothetical protein
MAAGDDALAVLRSIDASLKQLVAALVANAPKPVASDRDLDGQYGDPPSPKMPRDWTGPDYKGTRLSQCPPDLLDMLAEMYDYFATKAEANNETTANGKPVATFKRADAARARGWAKRKRAGWVSPVAATPPASDFGAASDVFDAPTDEMTADDIPF